MQADDIKNHPAYMCNRFGLRSGAIVAVITAVAALSYPPPNNIYVTACIALLSLFLLLTERIVLPRIRTFRALDLLVIGYCFPILVTELFSLWCYPTVEVATGVGCMVVLSALLFHSTMLMTVYVFVTVTSWMLLKWAKTDLPSPHEFLQILLIAPMVAFVARQVMLHTMHSLYTSQLSPVEPVDLTNNLRSVMEAACGKSASINILTRVPSATIMGNAAQVQQVLVNLVKNAADSIPDKGRIEITIARHPTLSELARNADYSFVSADYQGEFVSVTISDSGIGMERDTVRQMFDPYFTTKGTGHGFGLSNVLGIAKSHNASLTVQSELGQGTKVSLFFPRIGAALKKQSEIVPATEELKQLKHNAKILLVDDDKLVRDSLAEILAFHGWDVIKANSGQEAIEIITQSNDFAALIIDYSMPNMNGSETLKGIRDLGCHTPAILCSGHISDPAQALVLEQFQGFLAKPFHRLELEEALQRITNL